MMVSHILHKVLSYSSELVIKQTKVLYELSIIWYVTHEVWQKGTSSLYESAASIFRVGKGKGKDIPVTGHGGP
jgi:hypothetical protein